MEFFHGVVALLAFVVLVLAGLVAWLYMQQTRLLQAVNALAIAISTPPPALLPEPVQQAVVPTTEEEVQVEAPTEEDDRVSVYDADSESASTTTPEKAPAAETEHIDEDTDLTKKTVAQLRELLSAKGIPFNKSDKKPTLVSLLQATA